MAPHSIQILTKTTGFDIVRIANYANEGFCLSGIQGGIRLSYDLANSDAPSTLLADAHYQDTEASQAVANALRQQFKADQKGEKYLPMFFMVGATSSTGDALGPFIGWFLKRKGFTGEYLGDLNEPVHATNIREKVNEAWSRAMKKNKFPYIIAVDAAVGRPGRITVNRGPLKPGAGMGKTLPQVGSIHIMGGTAHFPFMIWFTGLDQTVAMAEVIADGLLSFFKDWESGALGPTEASTKTGSA
jgi:putative sporulation protein YyaC